MRAFSFKFRFLVVSCFLLFAQINLLGQSDSQQSNAGNKKDFTIAETKFEGLDSVSESEDEEEYRFYESRARLILREARIKVNPGAVFDKNEIDKAIIALKEWFASGGFLDSDIQIKVQQISDKSSDLIFSISRGTKTLVSEIFFTGNKVFTNTELAETIKNSTEWQIFHKDRFHYWLHKRTRDFVRSKGYLRATFGDFEIQRVGNYLTITIPVDEGIRYRYGKIEIDGANAFSSQEIMNLFSAKSGEIANGNKLREFFYEELKKRYAAKGYVEYSADIEPEFLPPNKQDEDGTVNLKITIDEERRFKLRQIVFLNVNEPTAKLLRQKINLKDNDFYNQEEFEKGIEEINRLNRFREIDKDKDTQFSIPVPPSENKPLERPTLKKKGEIQNNNIEPEKFAFLTIYVRIVNQ